MIYWMVQWQSKKNQGVGATNNGAQIVAHPVVVSTVPQMIEPLEHNDSHAVTHAAYASGPAIVSVINPIKRINIILRRIEFIFMMNLNRVNYIHILL